MPSRDIDAIRTVIGRVALTSREGGAPGAKGFRIPDSEALEDRPWIVFRAAALAPKLKATALDYEFARAGFEKVGGNDGAATGRD
jgi:hypothetical protein